MKLIQLAWTRDFSLAWAQWWTTLANPELIKIIGVGVDSQLSYFNGILLETYRLQEETEAFLLSVMNLGSDNPFFSKKKIKKYISMIKEIRLIIPNYDSSDFLKIKELSIETYPWYTVSYLLPQEKWASLFLAKNPNNKIIIERLIEARKESEGVISELCEYWRSISRQLLEKRKILEKYNGAITFKEIEEMLKTPSYIPDKKELEKRLKGYIYFKDRVYTGMALSEFFQKQCFFYQEEKGDKNISELKGNVASSHNKIIQGKAQIILHKDQVHLFKSGNILITIMTTPLFLPAMKKASAIITNEGGLTCHAAITARELGIPCIIGTKIATKIFKDNDLIEVDAEKGIIRKIKEKQASKKKDKTKIQNHKNTIELIIFDNYGVTLHGGYPDTMQDLAKEFHRDWKELQEIFYTKYFNQAVEQKISQQEAWKKAIDNTKLPISVEEVKKIHYHYFQLNHDIINLAKKLSKRYTILLLTKNTKEQVEDADKKLGFRKIFPNFINTGEYGLTKTSPKVFQIIFDKFNVHPEECIYIDDQAINLDAPRKLGIHTIHYQNIKQLKEELKRMIES